MKLLIAIEHAVHEAAKNHGKGGNTAPFQNLLASALAKRELAFRRQVWRPDHFAGMELNCGDFFDFEVEGKVAVVLAGTARELLDREKRLPEALERAGLEAGLVVWTETKRKDDRCRRVVPAECGARA